MNKFPRTMVGNKSVSRMIIGTNWMLGFSHYTSAKDNFIRTNIQKREKIADILEVFFREGIDTIMGFISREPLADAIKDAEDRTGIKAIIISTPMLPVTPRTPTEGFKNGEVEKILDESVSYGTDILMPHQGTVDSMVDRCTRKLRQMDTVMEMIRERKMIPGLSTHMPETIVYADESGLDIETYISIYNAMGFLMQQEVDWTAKIIQNAQKPVMTIKPMAAGHLRPFQALTFVWNAIREKDMVTVGTMTPDEAKEVIELSLSILEKRQNNIVLQETRSKSSVKKRM